MKHILTLSLCFLALSLTAQVDCPNPHDSDGDNAISITDLMALLSVFGEVDVDADGIWDTVDACIDINACNYSSYPSVLCLYLDVLGICGGTCYEDLDADGICDDVDDCIGEYDYCGVCNGTDCDFVCGDDVSHGNIDYFTVEINGQCWFADNCRYLPVVSPPTEESNTVPMYYVYGYNGTDVLAAMSTDNYVDYGVLYNFPAVISGNICPDGWHVPSKEEFSSLVNFLGVDAGYKMKATSGWWQNGNGSNESGFRAYPAGMIFSDNFLSLGSSTKFWSSSPSSTTDPAGITRSLNYGTNTCNQHNHLSEGGNSVRCIID